MNRYLLPLVGVLILIPFFIIALGNDPRELPSQFIDKPAPRFLLPTLRNPERTISAANLSGRPTLVNVWATWCVGCRQEHGFLMELAKTEAVPIYGINWRDNNADALRWLQQLGDPYVASGADLDGRVGIDWGVYGAPESFLVNADGLVVYRHAGPLDWSIWKREFEPRLQASVTP